jgi:hypothetical protein
MTDSAAAEGKLAIAASTGVGKTALIGYLQDDPRLAGRLVVDVDWYRRSKPQEPSSETQALRALLKKKVDVLFGVMIDERIRSRLQRRGWSFMVLCLPEAVHRDRLAEAIGTGGRAGMSVEESIRVQRRLEGLGYRTLDAARSIDAVAADIVHAVQRSDHGQRFAILGSWGVGKSALTRYLRSDAVSSGRRWRSRLVVDCASFIPNETFGDDLHAPSHAPRDRLQAWNRVERHAVRAAYRKRVDVVGATLTTRTRRAMLAEEGFSFVVLSLPEPIHRARLAKRLRETGRTIDVEAAVNRQRRLESLGYEAIDASRTLSEIADDVVAKVGAGDRRPGPPSGGRAGAGRPPDS